MKKIILLIMLLIPFKVLAVETSAKSSILIEQSTGTILSEEESHTRLPMASMTKMMTWYGIQMKTMTDDTTSKLSELLMQGTNMGIIEGRRLINQNPNADKDVKSVLSDFVTMQEDSVETLKKYL